MALRDIITWRAAFQKHPRRLRRWQIRERLEASGPLTLRLELKMCVPGSTRSQYICVERSHVLCCRTPDAVQYVRLRLRDLMRELDGVTVEFEPAPSPDVAQQHDS
jgi:hypothetical protein